MFKPWGRNRFREDSEDADDVDIFSRSEETLKRARAQQEAQRSQKRQKYLAKQDKSNRRNDEPSNTTTKNASPKRDEAVGHGDYVESIEGKPQEPPRRRDNLHTDTPPTRQSPRHTKATIITIDDSDDDESASHKPSRSKPNQPAVAAEPVKLASSAPVPVDEDDSDAEIRALAARSRARKAAAAAEQARLLQSSNASLSELPTTVESTQSIPSTQPASTTIPRNYTEESQLTSRSNDTTPSASSSDPIVSIFLHSRLPNTNPLIVNRRISQPLKAVRLAFCKTNHFAPDLEASVFLTWRGRRVFDISSCSSLCVDVDSRTGNIYIKGDRHGRPINARRPTDAGNTSFDDYDDDDGAAKLEMEIVTQAIFDADRQALQAKLNGTASAALQSRSTRTSTAAERRIKVILRGRGYEDYKLTVKPTTLFAQIVAAFRKQRGVPDGKDVYLMFDGERLDEDEKVAATDIDDMDFVDVHVK